HMMELKSLLLMQAHMTEESKSGKGPSEATSVAKNARARIRQEREELLIEIMGFRGLGQTGDDFSELELGTTRTFLANKA
ncbi:hypothetical protein, partial [Klebsiella pneumoniae]|uniref:hypothetical protein n=1 Tax=Klebsiella pneumoniae TaxID=573 RepID=UPI001952A8A6